MTEKPKRYGPEPKWIVMVFMGANNLPDEKDLTKEAETDINEMEAALAEWKAAHPKSDSNVAVLVQVHGKNRVYRQHINHGDPEDVSVDEQDATDGVALGAFLKWATEKSERQKHDRTMLVMWGHAYRFAIGHAAVQGRPDAIDFAELSQTLRNMQERRPPETDPKLDIVGFDACDLATAEIAAELAPFARYLVASQIGVPLPGWPYDKVLKRLCDPKGPMMTPAELGSFAVRQYCAFYFEQNPNPVKPVSLTLIDLQRMDEVRRAVDALAVEIALVLDDPEEQALLELLFLQSQIFPGKPFVDVADLCLNLAWHANSKAVCAAAAALGDILIRPADTSTRVRDDEPPRPAVIEHGRNAYSTARLHGLSLYAPHVQNPNETWPEARRFYEKLAFAQTTLWSKLVHAFAES